MDTSAKLEALLFLAGEPLAVDKIAKLLNIDEKAVEAAVEKLSRRLADDSGLALIREGRLLQLATRKELADLTKKIAEDELSGELTPACLETLAVIAYKGPLSRVQVDHWRGVNSSYTLRKLLIRGLINRQEGGLYAISLDCLKKLGLTASVQFPEYQKYSALELTDED